MEQRTAIENVECWDLGMTSVNLSAGNRIFPILEIALIPYRDYFGVGRNGSVAKWIPDLINANNYAVPGHFQAMGFSCGFWQIDDMAYGRRGFSPLAIIPQTEESDIAPEGT